MTTGSCSYEPPSGGTEQAYYVWEGKARLLLGE
jgi:hypothetical protein